MSKERQAYVKNWQKQTYLIRRTKWMQENGPCRKCGSWADLELDHINPETKITNSIWLWADSRRLAELSKCQVLCRICHKKKTKSERFASRKKYKHGTSGSYKRAACRCHACSEAESLRYRTVYYTSEKRHARYLAEKKRAKKNLPAKF